MTFTAKEIWEAGRAALGLTPTAASVPAAPAIAPVPVAPVEVAADNATSVFDPATFAFEPREYRIHFKNGCSGEYDGAPLATSFPFDVAQIERVEPVEEVGQDL